MVCTISSARRGVALGRFGVAEHAERDHDEVDVADAREHVVDERGMRREVGGVERHRLDRGRAGGAQLVGARVEALGIAAREHDRARPATDELARDRDADIGTAAEHEHRLHCTDGVFHAALRSGTRSRRRPRSLRMTPSRVDTRARLAPPIELGIHRRHAAPVALASPS